MAETVKRRKTSRYITDLYEQRRRWANPEVVINPVGMILYVGLDGKWTIPAWARDFLAELRRVIALEKDPAPPVMLSIPDHLENAGYWDLALLQSGFSAFYDDADLPWPKSAGGMPVSGVVALPNIGYPPKLNPYFYIDCLPERIIQTLNREGNKKPHRAIYWRPDSEAIASLARMGIEWNDRENDLLDYDCVRFAGLPEDVLSALM
ncbi:hypothetical protein HAP93_00910 [Acidithiobacillus ferriphilus]|uniref:hypothetical protein n=1 Tax=Acidithiobacillus ferriphilus TaxID=1689834 RepID=UPI001C0604B5|nr:hypothetical protein [Acidithiobacillus ferriphilus]MBU2784340.1 hypothetical protein [Acidithiobacillus ferriphilus]